ncbi:MAG: hypothetical protein M5T61_07900 [Acidimicrobiia bacterium]|nr:hypothetical protein [Acidimicrobiia bacterium]
MVTEAEHAPRAVMSPSRSVTAPPSAVIVELEKRSPVTEIGLAEPSAEALKRIPGSTP